MMGLVKEVGVDDPGLLEFHLQYFSYPLYRDVDLSFYQAMGNRKIGLRTWNPLRLYRGFQNISERMAKKKIDGNLVGEGLVQGGVLVIDRQGKIQYAYEEDVGDPLEVEDIKAALMAVMESTTEKEDTPDL